MPPPDKSQREWIEEVLGVGSATASGVSGGGAAGIVAREAAKFAGGAKLPSPAEAAEHYEEKTGAKPGAGAKPKAGDAGDSMPATQFGASKSAVQDDDSRLSPDVEYEKLPKDLKEKLNQGFWAGLGKQQRWTLTETFRRMNSYGVWKEVKAVIGEKEQPEAHAAFGGFEFQVAGNSGGIIYEAFGAKSLISKLKGTGNFGEDGSLIGSEHKGQVSIREGPGGSSMGLHIAVGPGNNFDAHIDRVSPTKKPEGGKTKIDPVKGLEHQVTELRPEKIRKAIKVPGVIFEGSVSENRDSPHGEVKVGVKVELRGPVEKTKPKLDDSKPRPNPPADEIVKKIVQRAEHTKNYFPVPIGAIPNEVPLPKDIAAELAAKMLEAGRKRDNRVRMDLPYYLNKDKKDQAKAAAMMEELGRIARSELGAQAESVTGLTVTFGTYNQGETVSIAD